VVNGILVTERNLAAAHLGTGSVKRYFKNNGKYIKDAYGTSQDMEAFGGYDTSIVANVNAVAEYSKTIIKEAAK
jgi:hypothetical protein